MIVIIAGMHRSGTSALAGMLHRNGIIMGEPENWKPKASRENPRGFYENKLFRIVNDRLLNERGYKVKLFEPEIPMSLGTCSDELREEMAELLRTYCHRYPAWGWKDPRTCLTIGIWLSVMHTMGLIHRLRILVPIRPPQDIASSMIRRGNKEELTGQFVELALSYSQHTQMGIGYHEYLEIDFNDLIYKTKKIAGEISDFLGIKITDTTFIEPRLANRSVKNG